MSKIKNEYFDQINTEMEKAKLYKSLTEYPVTEDFSPILLAQEFYGKFQLTDKQVVEEVREYYNF
jgi:hypothetical protein